MDDGEFASRGCVKEYVFSFDDEMLDLKRRHADAVRFVDLRECGTIHRLINDNQLDPNLRVFYWPPPDVRTTPPTLPRRIYLVARRDIAPEVELTWDYGALYHRHWLGAGENEADYGDDDSSSDAATEDEPEWTTENWAQCDKCDKWWRLPAGVGYCAEALPEQWFCSYNPNTQRNSCEKPEERMVRGEIWEGEGGREVGESDGEEEDEEEDEEEVRAAEDDDDVEDEAEGTSGAPSRAAATAAPAATARGGGRGSGVSAAKAPAAVGWTVDEFLANQSDSDDSEDTKVAKRRKRSEMKQKLREARERA